MPSSSDPNKDEDNGPESSAPSDDQPQSSAGSSKKSRKKPERAQKAMKKRKIEIPKRTPPSDKKQGINMKRKPQSDEQQKIKKGRKSIGNKSCSVCGEYKYRMENHFERNHFCGELGAEFDKFSEGKEWKKGWTSKVRLEKMKKEIEKDKKKHKFSDKFLEMYRKMIESITTESPSNINLPTADNDMEELPSSSAAFNGLNKERNMNEYENNSIPQEDMEVQSTSPTPGSESDSESLINSESASDSEDQKRVVVVYNLILSNIEDGGSEGDEDEDDDGDSIDIKIKTPPGKTIDLNVNSKNTINTVKLQIQGEEKILACQQRLIFNDNQLEDCHTLAYYKIQNESTLYLELRDLREGEEFSYLDLNKDLKMDLDTVLSSEEKSSTETRKLFVKCLILEFVKHHYELDHFLKDSSTERYGMVYGMIYNILKDKIGCKDKYSSLEKELKDSKKMLKKYLKDSVDVELSETKVSIIFKKDEEQDQLREKVKSLEQEKKEWEDPNDEDKDQEETSEDGKEEIEEKKMEKKLEETLEWYFGNIEDNDKQLLEMLKGLHEDSKPLFYPSQIHLALKIWEKVNSHFDKTGVNFKQFESVEFLLVGPDQNSIKFQTLDRLQHVDELLGGGLLEGKEASKKHVKTTSMTDLKTFKDFREKALTKKNVLFVVIHDECHWGFERESFRDLVLNERFANKIKPGKKREYVEEICKSIEEKKYHTQPNVIQLLVSATPFVCQTNRSYIKEDNEIRVVDYEKTVLTSKSASGKMQVTLRNHEGRPLIALDGKKVGLGEKETEHDRLQFSFEEDEGFWRISSEGNELSVMHGGDECPLKKIKVTPVLAWGADTIAFYYSKMETIPSKSGASKNEESRFWLCINEDGAFFKKIARSRQKPPLTAFFFYEKQKRSLDEQQYLSLNFYIRSRIESKHHGSYPRGDHGRLYETNERRSLLREDPIIRNCANNEATYYRLLADYIFEIIRQGVFGKPEPNKVFLDSLVDKKKWEDVDSKIEMVLKDLGNFRALQTGESVMKKGDRDVNGGSKTEAKEKTNETAITDKSEAFISKLRKELKAYWNFRIKDHIQMLETGDEKIAKKAWIHIARLGGIVKGYEDTKIRKAVRRVRPSKTAAIVPRDSTRMTESTQRDLERALKFKDDISKIWLDSDGIEELPAGMDETERIVNDLIGKSRETPQGPMILIRITRREYAKLFFMGLRIARNVAKIYTKFAVLADYGDSKLTRSIEEDRGETRESYWEEWVKKKNTVSLSSSSRTGKKRETTFEDLHGMPCIVVVVAKARMGDTFPKSLQCLDMRAKSMNDTIRTYRSTFIQELGRLCRYTTKENIQKGKLPYALMNKKILNYMRINQENYLPCILDTKLNIDGGMTLIKDKKHLARHMYREKYEPANRKMDFPNKNSEKRDNRFLLIAEPQMGKTGIFLCFLTILYHKINQEAEEDTIPDDVYCEGGPWLEYVPWKDDIPDAKELLRKKVQEGKYGAYHVGVDIWKEKCESGSNKHPPLNTENKPLLINTVSSQAEKVGDKPDKEKEHNFSKYRLQTWSVLHNYNVGSGSKMGQFSFKNGDDDSGGDEKSDENSKEATIQFSCPGDLYDEESRLPKLELDQEKQKTWIFIPTHRDNPRIINGNIPESQGKCIQVLVVRQSKFKVYRELWGRTHIVMAIDDKLELYRDGKPITPEDGAAGFTRYCIVEIAKYLELKQIFMLDDNIVCMYECLREKEGKTIEKRNPIPILDALSHMESQLSKDNEELQKYQNDRKLSNAQFLKIKDIEGKTLRDYTGGRERVAIIGTRRASFAMPPKAKFEQTWVYSMVLVNIEALQSRNLNYHPGWYIWEDFDMMKRCADKKLVTVRYNGYLHQKRDIRTTSWRHKYIEKIPFEFENGASGNDLKIKPVYFRKYGKCSELKQIAEKTLFKDADSNIYHGELRFNPTRPPEDLKLSLIDVLQKDGQSVSILLRKRESYQISFTLGFAMIAVEKKSHTWSIENDVQFTLAKVASELGELQMFSIENYEEDVKDNIKMASIVRKAIDNQENMKFKAVYCRKIGTRASYDTWNCKLEMLGHTENAGTPGGMEADDSCVSCEPRLSGDEVAQCLHKLPWEAQSKVQLIEMRLRFDTLSFQEMCGKNLQRFKVKSKRYVRKHIKGVLRVRLLSVRSGSVIALIQLLRNLSIDIVEAFDDYSDEEEYEGDGSESNGYKDLGVASETEVKSQSAINFVNEREQERNKPRIDEVKSHLAFLSWCALSSKENENLNLDLDSEIFERINRLPCADGKKVETTRWKANKPNLVPALVSNCTILHYSGHGEKEGLLFDNDGKSVVISGQDFLKAIEDAKKTETYELKLLFLAACHSQAVGKEVAKLVDHVIVCKESEKLGDIEARIFQYHFYQWFFRGATILNSFEHAKESIHKRADSLAKRYKNMMNNYSIKGENETAALDMINKYVKSMRNEAENYVLIPADGDHNVKFRFIECELRGERRRYSDVKYARPKRFMPYLLKEMKTIERNFVSDIMEDPEDNSDIGRWVHIVGLRGVGKTFLAKEMGWRLSHDMDAPDAIFFIELKKILKRNDNDGDSVWTYNDGDSVWTYNDGDSVWTCIDSELYKRSQKRLQAYASTGQKILIILDDLNVIGVDAAMKTAIELLDCQNNLTLMTTSCNSMDEPIQAHEDKYKLSAEYREIELRPKKKEYAMQRLFRKALLHLEGEGAASKLKLNLEFLASNGGVRYIWVRSATANSLLSKMQRSKKKPSNPKNMTSWALEFHKFCKEGKEGDFIRLIDENFFIFEKLSDMDENGKRVSSETMKKRSKQKMNDWICEFKKE